jgi:hypothetical protein
MTLSVTKLVNLAFLEIPCARITSISDNVFRAEVAREVYPQVIDELMELEWSFATRRAALTSVPNDRVGVWGYAFALPEDLGFPLRLRIIRDTTGYVPLAGQTIGTYNWRTDPGIMFDTEGDTIWADSPAVELEYVVRTPDFARMTPAFEKAVTFGLAARCSMPIRKDRNEADKLVQMAEVYRDRAYAADLNRNASANTYGNNYVPEVIRQLLEAPE